MGPAGVSPARFRLARCLSSPQPGWLRHETFAIRHNTSGARETIFIKFFSLNSRATGPKIRVPRGFDGHGNYTLGVSDQSIFPEIELDKIKRNIGFDVTIVTTARTNAEAKSLLSEMGMPFSDRAKKLATASPSEGGPAGQAQAA